MRERERIR